MSSVLDFLLMLMNLQQQGLVYSPNLPSPSLQSANPYASLEAMPNVHIIRGTPKPREVPSSTPSAISNTIPTPLTQIDVKNLLEVKMNKCCPLNYHYAEDKFGRMKCKKHDSDIDRVVAKSKVFKTVKQYACEASMGQYIDDFSLLDLNGDGFVKYKSEVYEKYCMDYDVRVGKFIIIKCKGKVQEPPESRVMEILKKRAERLNEIEAPVKKPKLKTQPTRAAPPTTTTTMEPTAAPPTSRGRSRTTTTTLSPDEYSYEEVEEEETRSSEESRRKPQPQHVPEIRSRGTVYRDSVAMESKSDDYSVEYEYEEVE